MQVLLAAALLALAADPPQAPNPTPALQTLGPDSHQLRLEPQVPTGDVRLRWSPKGAAVPLTPVALQASGPEGVQTVTGLKGVIDFAGYTDSKVILKPALEPGGPLALFANGIDRPGGLLATPSESRGKIWYSWEHTFDLVSDWNLGKPSSAAPNRPYPVSLWYVVDPSAPDAEPVLRWSRRGWHEAYFAWQGQLCALLICDMRMDGMFDEHDAWYMEVLGPLDPPSSEPPAANAAPWQTHATSRPLSRHAWLGEAAFRMRQIDAEGFAIELEPFDPGITRAEEAALDDAYAADRRAPRAAAPLAFSHDFEAAESLAKQTGRPLFIDFETTWCGPCKQMDGLVYTAKAVVDAAAAVNAIAVKVDGDERPDLKERFAVEAYPTLILLTQAADDDPSGSELTEHARRVGYQSVTETAAFLSAQ